MAKRHWAERLMLGQTAIDDVPWHVIKNYRTLENRFGEIIVNALQPTCVSKGLEVTYLNTDPLWTGGYLEGATVEVFKPPVSTEEVDKSILEISVDVGILSWWREVAVRWGGSDVEHEYYPVFDLPKVIKDAIRFLKSDGWENPTRGVLMIPGPQNAKQIGLAHGTVPLFARAWIFRIGLQVLEFNQLMGSEFSRQGAGCLTSSTGRIWNRWWTCLTCCADVPEADRDRVAEIAKYSGGIEVDPPPADIVEQAKLEFEINLRRRDATMN